MYWLVYTNTEVGQHVLHVTQSETRPEGVEVINHGFRYPEQALAVMSHYLEVDQAGFVRVNELLASEPVSAIDRLLLAYRVAPAGLALLSISLLLSIVAIVLLLVHIL